MDRRLLGASAQLSLVASLCSFRSMSGTVSVGPVPVLLSVRSAIPRAPTLPAYQRVLEQSDVRALNERELTVQEKEDVRRVREQAGVVVEADDVSAEQVVATVATVGEGQRRPSWI